jgi:hypothetical protein
MLAAPTKAMVAYFHSLLPKDQRSPGMHLFGEQSEIKQKIKQMVEEEQAYRASAAGSDASAPFEPWVEAGNAKVKLWKMLSSDEKQVWRKRSKQLGQSEFLYSE